MHNSDVTKQNTALNHNLKEGNQMEKQKLTNVLNSMKYMNTNLMSDKKVSAVAPMDTFREQYTTAKKCHSLISKSYRRAGN